MVTIIGNVGCTNCEKAKMLLERKGIEFEYKLLNELPKQEKFEVLQLSRANKQVSLPIILKDGAYTTLENLLGE